MKSHHTTLLGLLLVSFGAQAQSEADIVRRADGTPELVSFERSTAPGTSEAATAFRSTLGLGQQSELRPLRAAETDGMGLTHQRYQQYYQGVPVEFSAYTTHSRNGKIEFMTGETRPLADGALSVQPRLTAPEALRSALAFVHAAKYQWELPTDGTFASESASQPTGELVIVDNILTMDQSRHGKQVLAWKFNIYAAQPVSRAWIYVDATTGEVVNQDAIIKHASFQTKYSGARPVETTYVPAMPSIPGYYKLHDGWRGAGIRTYNMQRSNSGAIDFKDTDNAWTAAEYNNANQDWVAGDAHFGAEMSYDYWSAVHGRNSFNNAGGEIRNYVHFDDTPGDGHGFDNAFWNGAEMIYGDGNTRFRPLPALDVCAHELGHAVCQYTANLQYQNESGALNEGFSDIWGACVEARAVSIYALAGKSTWTIGEEVKLGGGALRSMSNPKLYSQPNTYQGVNWWPNAATPTDGNDYGGVHYNSGVLNYWFYLLSQGGAGTNDKGNAYTVTGVGIDKAARIAYLTEQLLSPTSGFASARTMAQQAAITLYGANSAEWRAVTNAWYAVGVGSSIAHGTGSPLYIDYVALGAYSRTSGSDGGYSPASSQAPASALTRCGQYTLTYSRGGYVPVNTIARSYWNAYIDYNQDGDFTDADERIMTNQWSYSSDGLQASFVVPSAALGGLTRMRIVMSGAADPAQCGSIGGGEVEEHFVNIATTLAAPINLRAAAVRSASAMLTWTAVAGATAYKMEYRVGAGFWMASSLTYTSNLQTISGLTAGTTYTYRVAAISSCNTVSAYSASVTFTTPVARPTGTSPDATPSTPITVEAYPNPAADVLHLNLAADADGNTPAVTDVMVYDLRGARVQQVRYDGNGTLHLDGLTPGLYTATVLGGSAPASVRFVKE